MSRLTIGRLATECDVPVSTIRYWERAGLITPGERTASNYRVYDTDAMARVRLIRVSQSLGFTVADIRTRSMRNLCENPVAALRCRALDRLNR